MARPKRCRRVCSEPEYTAFVPEGLSNGGKVILTMDEYEAVRLVDFEKMTHEQCALQMDISRTTVTEIYEQARFKIADAVVNGKRLQIEGGNYKLDSGELPENNQLSGKEKGIGIMRIAVTYENGQIFQHFGHTQMFKVYDVEEGKVVRSMVVDTMGQGHSALAGFLMQGRIDVLICGGIGGGAQNALAQAGIKLYGGVSGDADAAVEAYLNGQLDYNPNVQCNHHGEGHTCGGHGHDHGEGHSCGGHGGSCGHGCH